jgi:tRNA threonylcarbamoyladenosine biosynthesis protein TsaB
MKALLGLDTSTAASTAAVLRADGRGFDVRPAPSRLDEPPAHARELMPAVGDALQRAGLGFGELDAIAVGVGPGGFTGLRIGIATARALAQGHGLPLVAVGSLEALALGADGTVAAVLDARRGEAFAGVWAGGRELVEPAALSPEALAERLAGLEAPVQAVGDGAVRFRAELEGAGVVVPADGSTVHRIGAAQLCRLGAVGEPAERDRLLPDYRREPDAKPPQR